MNTDTLTLLRNEISAATANLKKCDATYKGFKTFKGNHQGLEFCANQLLQAATGLRDHAERIAVIADDVHERYSNTPQQMELDDITVNGHR